MNKVADKHSKYNKLTQCTSVQKTGKTCTYGYLPPAVLLVVLLLFFNYIFASDYFDEPWFLLDLVSPSVSYYPPRELVSKNVQNLEQKLKDDLPFDYIDLIFNFPGYGRDNAIEFEIEGKRGLLDFDGTVVISPYAEKLGEYSEGMAVFYEGLCEPSIKNELADPKKCKAGFLNKNGVAIPAIFEEAKSFRNGIAAVLLDGKWQYIDTSGKVISISVTKEQKQSKVNKKNHAVDASNSQKVQTQKFNRDGLTKITIENNPGLVGDNRFGASRDGKVVIPAMCCVDLYNYEDIYICWNPDIFPDLGFVGYDKNGNIVLNPKKVSVFQGSSESFEAYIKIDINGKQTYINKAGKYRKDRVFDKVSGFKKGIAIVNKGNKFGIINKNGNFLKISPP